MKEKDLTKAYPEIYRFNDGSYYYLETIFDDDYEPVGCSINYKSEKRNIHERCLYVDLNKKPKIAKNFPSDGKHVFLTYTYLYKDYLTILSSNGNIDRICAQEFKPVMIDGFFHVLTADTFKKNYLYSFSKKHSLFKIDDFKIKNIIENADRISGIDLKSDNSRKNITYVKNNSLFKLDGSKIKSKRKTFIELQKIF